MSTAYLKAVKESARRGPCLLTASDCDEALRFLSLRPAHTAFLSGLMLDNGAVSPLNRGEFYGYRNGRGELEGVALIGQKNIIEAHSPSAFRAFAHLALADPRLQLICAEEGRMKTLLAHLERVKVAPRVIYRGLLLEQNEVLEGFEPVAELCHARSEDLDAILAINSAMAFEESGTNPLKRDLRGMTERTRRRIEQGRVWVLAEAGKIVFKADVICLTPQAAFLEGVYTSPQARGRGTASRCLTQLGRILLRSVPSITLVVNQENLRAVNLYHRINYRMRGPYLTLYF